MELVGVFRRVAAAVPDGGGAAVGGLPRFHHKACIHPGDGQAVVVALLDQAQEVGAGLGGLVGEQHRTEYPCGGVKHRHRIPRHRMGELQLSGVDLGRAGHPAPCRAAAKAARQTNPQGNNKGRCGPFPMTRHNFLLASYHVPCTPRKRAV